MAAGRDSLNLARAYEGRTFGGYRIARAIATGGMATVFLARRTGPGRFAQTAALKVIHPHLADEREFVEMFLDEARIASSINHPNVCRVLDFGQAEGTFYLALEYVRGETWATTLAALNGRRESRARLAALSAYVVGQACEGLHAVHDALDTTGHPLQIVHRDISPQNLFVAYDGSVRVLDFGIASARDRAQGSSTTQVVKGRYAYMAPEQVRGLDVDRRADIWSLGVVLREALGGERLFERDTQVATILAVTKEAMPVWPRHVPLMLRDACDRALERDPEARFATARDLGSALGRYLSSELEPVSGAELGRWMRALFPNEIAEKRAELRELAGDDTNTGTFSAPVVSLSPHSVTTRLPMPSGGGLFNSQTPGPGTTLRPRRNWRIWSVAAAGSLLAAFLAFRLTPQLLPTKRALPGAPLLRTEVRQGTSAADLAALQAVPAPRPVLNPTVEPLFPLPAEDAPSAAVMELPPEPPAELAERRRRRSHRHRRAETETDATATPAKPAEPAPKPNAPVEPASGPGSLVIGAARGWASVAVDGVELGNTPLRTQLPAGKHRLEVRFFNTGSPQWVNVELRAGEVTKLRLEQ